MVQFGTSRVIHPSQNETNQVLEFLAVHCYRMYDIECRIMHAVLERKTHEDARIMSCAGHTTTTTFHQPDAEQQGLKMMGLGMECSHTTDMQAGALLVNEKGHKSIKHVHPASQHTRAKTTCSYRTCMLQIFALCSYSSSQSVHWFLGHLENTKLEPVPLVS